MEPLMEGYPVVTGNSGFDGRFQKVTEQSQICTRFWPNVSVAPNFGSAPSCDIATLLYFNLSRFSC